MHPAPPYEESTLLRRLADGDRQAFTTLYSGYLDSLYKYILLFTALTPAKTANYGPGTLIQQNPIDGMFFPTHGEHHGYDPDIPDMWTGFIAFGAGIKKGATIPQLGEQDIAPLIAQLLGLNFKTPDGKLIPGILEDGNNLPGTSN